MRIDAPDVEVLIDTPLGTGEGPLWSAAEQALYFVDIEAPALFRFDPARARPGCVAPALAYIDAPTPKVGVPAKFAVEGWAFKDEAGISRFADLETRILSSLKERAGNPEALARALGEDPLTIDRALGRLELAGAVVRDLGGYRRP